MTDSKKDIHIYIPKVHFLNVLFLCGNAEEYIFTGVIPPEVKIIHNISK